MALDHVFRPITVNRTEFRNRVVRSAHGTGLGRGEVNDDLIAYHEARAKGGVAMSILEASSVHPSSGVGGVAAYSDAMIPGYARLAEAAHRHGMVMMQQLIHTGAHAAPPDGGPPWAPSAIPSVRHLRASEGQGDVPVEMTRGMIDEVIAAFADAARRAREGGLDGVEIHYGHSFLIMQFLSPAMNRRTDRYGGSAENRRRFGKEGVAVLFATPHTGIGPQTVGALMRDPALRRLTDHRSGFTLIPRTQLLRVGDGAVTLRSLDSGVDREWAADSAVVVSGNVAERALAEALDGYAGEVFVVGDALAPRPIERAVHDGHHAALRVGGGGEAHGTGRPPTPPANALSGGG